MFSLDAPSLETLDVLLGAWPDARSLAREPYDSPVVQHALELFMRAAYGSDLMTAFNWRKRFASGAALMDPTVWAKASPGYWRALMIAHVSLEQSCQGHLLELRDHV